MKIHAASYGETNSSLFPPFYITVCLDFYELPTNAHYRKDGVEVWKEYLSLDGIYPDLVQRLGDSFRAQLFWNDKSKATAALEKFVQSGAKEYR